MKGAVLFAAGVLVGTMMTQSGIAQDVHPRSLNHIGIVVKNFDQARDFYTKTLGFKEALLTYLQLSRDTFLELLPAGPNQPPGLNHFGIEYGDLQAEVAQMRAQGFTVANPGLTPAKALFARTKDPDGISIDLMEFGPDALQRKAMDAWKP